MNSTYQVQSTHYANVALASAHAIVDDLIAAKWETFRAVADGRVTQAEESNIMGLLTAQLKARMAEKYGRVIK